MAEEMPRVWCNSSKAESRAPHNECNSKGTSKKQQTSNTSIHDINGNASRDRGKFMRLFIDNFHNFTYIWFLTCFCILTFFINKKINMHGMTREGHTCYLLYRYI